MKSGVVNSSEMVVMENRGVMVVGNGEVVLGIGGIVW